MRAGAAASQPRSPGPSARRSSVKDRLEALLARYGYALAVLAIAVSTAVFLPGRDRLQRLSKQRFLDVVPIEKADLTLPTCVTVVVSKAMSLDPDAATNPPWRCWLTCAGP